MQAQLWMSGRCFECGVDRIERTADGWVVRTASRRYFRLEAGAIALLRMLMRLDALDLDDPAHAQAARFLELKLVPLGIYRPRGLEAPSRAAGATAGAMRWHRQLLKPRHVRPLAALLAPLFAPWPMGAMLVLALVVHVHCAWTVAGQIGYRDLVTYAPGELLALVAVSALRCLLHELGHAAACLRLTGSVGGIGCGVFIATPVLYCDVSDIHLLPRQAKAAVGCAGTAMDLLVLALWAAVGGATPLGMKVYVMGMIGVGLNVLPFYRSDGYWVLNDLAGSRDLLKQALQAARAGHATAADRLLLGFTACCLAAALALAAAFALRYGPQQVAEVVLRWPDFTAVVLAGITALQYAALVFGVLAAARAWVRRGGRDRARRAAMPWRRPQS